MHIIGRRILAYQSNIRISMYNKSNLFTKPGHYSYSRLTVVVGGRVVGGGGRPEQLTLRSLSVPVDMKVTKPGWSLVIWLLIQD